MSPFLVAAALLLACPTPGPAQDVSARTASERCRAFLERLPFLQPSGPAVAVEPVGSDGCRFDGVRVAIGGPAGYEIASLLIQGNVFDRPVPDGPPVAVRAEARGTALSIRSGHPALDWVTRQQQVPFDLVLDATYDPASKRAVLRELSMDGASIGRVSLEGVVEDLDAPAGAAALPQQAEALGMRSLRVRLDSRRFIAGYVLPPLASTLPNEDPGGAVERAKAAAVRIARDVLPGAGALAGTVAAITGFVRDFPHPRHPFEIAVQAASGPVRAEDLARVGASWAELPRLLSGLRVEASYEGMLR